MESGPSRVNAPLEGPVIPRSRRSLSRTKASQEFTMHTPDKQVPCGGALHAKEEVGRGGCSAPGMVQCRGTRRRGTVVGVCLVPEEGAGMRV